MTCDEMRKISQLSEAVQLIAGEKGLKNNIRWIYFADCLECIKSEYRMENYIHGGEFVIFTNRSITEDSPKLIQLVERMEAYQISAIGINEGQIPEELIVYCEKNEIPLFELAEKYPLIDLSQLICQRLVFEEQGRKTEERFFSSMLDMENYSKEDLLEQARELDFPLEGRFCVAEIAMKKEGEKQKELPSSVEQGLARMIKSEFLKGMKQNVILLSQIGALLLLIPVEQREEEVLEEIFRRILRRMKNRFQLEAYVGIGNTTEYLDELRISRNEAFSAIKVGMAEKGQEAIFFFRRQGIFTLLSHVDDIRILDQFVENNLGKLKQTDRINNGNLCETLECYLNHHCNAKQTAEVMHLHRNTLNYRLRKICEITGYQLENLDTCLQLKLSFLIANYRKKN